MKFWTECTFQNCHKSVPTSFDVAVDCFLPNLCTWQWKWENITRRDKESRVIPANKTPNFKSDALFGISVICLFSSIIWISDHHTCSCSKDCSIFFSERAMTTRVSPECYLLETEQETLLGNYLNALLRFGNRYRDSGVIPQIETPSWMGIELIKINQTKATPLIASF